MQSRWIRQVLSLCFLLVIPALAVGQDAPEKEKPKPKPLRPPVIDAEIAGKKAILYYDTNKDDRLSDQELKRCPGLKAAKEQVDTEDTGEITAEMIADRIKKWKKSKLGRMSLACTVLHKGVALAGAEVKFVPEVFLGLDEEKFTATGKTDQNGMAMISIPVSGERTDPPGVPPGFYRVEITKAGEKIPAKYNKKTIFGQEIANDAKGIQEGIKFELDY